MRVERLGSRWGSISRRRVLAGALTGATLLVIPRGVLGSTGSASATADPDGNVTSPPAATPASGPVPTASPVLSPAPAGPAIGVITPGATYGVVTDGITYRGQAGTVYRPDVTQAHPVVYFLHGGFWQAGDRHQYDLEAQDWAARGWVAVTMDYSLGVDYRTMVRDIWAGVRYVASQPYADGTRQVIMGDSAGGHLAALMAVQYPDHFRGQILWSPVISPANAYVDGVGRPRGEVRLRLASKQIAGLDWRGADPSLQVTKDTPPLWIAASTQEFVPYARQGKLLVTALGRKRAQVHLMKGVVHGRRLDQGMLLRSARAWAREQVQT